MSWILLVTGAYLLLAVANVSDKIFLKALFRHPAVLAVIIGGMGVISFVLIPFGHFGWPGIFYFCSLMMAGVCFVLALLFFFHALSAEEASRVIPYVGALIPIVTLVFASAFLNEELARSAYIGFALLIIGGYIVAHDPWSHPKEHSFHIWIMASLGAMFFAISFVLSKWLFSSMDFIQAFVWIRVGSLLAALVILLISVIRGAKYLKEFRHVVSKGFLAFLGVQAVGGVGFILQNVAISKGSVSLVNAMQGIQYVFVIVFAGLLAKRFPRLIQEKISRKIVVAKLVGVVVIGVGLILIA